MRLKNYYIAQRVESNPMHVKTANEAIEKAIGMLRESDDLVIVYKAVAEIEREKLPTVVRKIK